MMMIGLLRLSRPICATGINIMHTLQANVHNIGNLGSLARMIDIQAKYDSRTKHATVSLPGLAYDDIDVRTGAFNPVRITQWGVMARIVTLYKPREDGETFLEYAKMIGDNYDFFASVSTEVSKNMYSITSQTMMHSRPFTIRLHLGYIGKTSLSIVATILDQRTDEQLARNLFQLTTVSRETRRPVAIPDWWRHKYASYVIGNECLIIPVKDVPKELVSGMARYEMNVRWSDTDMFGHTNYLSYVKFCFDAAMWGCRTGRYSLLKNDITKYKVCSMQMTYKTESLANDTLTIISWENPANPMILNFSIQKGDLILVQIAAEFYEPDSH